jgi:N-terminal acetyltransferase B complex non-catalytic subunit
MAASTDHLFVVESLHQLGVSFSKFLRDLSGLTPHERILYNLLSLLSAIVVESVESTRSAPTVDSLQGYISSVTSSLEFLLDMTAGALTNDSPVDRAMSMMSSLYPIACIRDAAVATKLAAAHVNRFNDRQKEKDRSGASCLKKEVVAGIKALDTAAKETLKEAEAWIAAAAKYINGNEISERLKRHVATLEGVGGAEGLLEEAASKVLRSDGDDEVNIWTTKMVTAWRQNVEGWEQVKWE